MIKTAFWRTFQRDHESKDVDENENTYEEQGSPVIRIHPPEIVNPKGSPSLSKWSPAITRTNKDDDIPFELPPSVVVRFDDEPQTFPETLSLPQISRCRSMSLAVPSKPNNASPIANGTTRPNKTRSHQRAASVDVRAMHRLSYDYSNTDLLGKIEPELYRTSSQCRSRCGRMWFSLVYDGVVESLTVTVLKMKQLPSRPSKANTPRDSFVKVFLLPDEKHSHQTKVRHRSNNPVFNETFSFQISNSEIRQRVIRFSVYDEDKKKSSRYLLGHALVHLDDVDFSKANEEMWRDLDDIAKPGDVGSFLGDICVSLSYIPNAEKLSVVVKEAKNLRKIDLDATAQGILGSRLMCFHPMVLVMRKKPCKRDALLNKPTFHDPVICEGIYIKITLSHGNRVVKTKKTSTKVGQSDPKFNESFYYKLTTDDMEQASLSFTVITQDGYGALQRFTSSVKQVVTQGRFGVENKYGKVTIGSTINSRGEQSLHWNETLSLAPKSISKWHPLSEVLAM